MLFPLSYKCLKNSIYKHENYSLLAIKYENRNDILCWRNAQIELLRQKELLTPDQQDTYFKTEIYALFDKEKPKQILFGFYKDKELIGYGGLVHINWKDKNSEISFLLDNKIKTETEYLINFEKFLILLEKVAYEIKLHKIYTYGYDLAEYRFLPLKKLNFKNEVILKDQIKINKSLYDAKIYSKLLL